MTRSHGRCRKGERLRMGFPHGHRKTTTLVAGLRMTGMVAPMVLDGPINGDWFEAYVAQVLVPELRPGDVVILRPGERVPVDGEVTDGSSFVDESMITGEPAPVRKEAGSTVTGGTVSAGDFTVV